MRFSSDGLIFVRRPNKRRFHERYTVKTVKHGGGSVFVWGAFSGHGKGPLLRIEVKKFVEVLSKAKLLGDYGPARVHGYPSISHVALCERTHAAVLAFSTG